MDDFFDGDMKLDAARFPFGHGKWTAEAKDHEVVIVGYGGTVTVRVTWEAFQDSLNIHVVEYEKDEDPVSRSISRNPERAVMWVNAHVGNVMARHRDVVT